MLLSSVEEIELSTAFLLPADRGWTLFKLILHAIKRMNGDTLTDASCTAVQNVLLQEVLWVKYFSFSSQVIVFAAQIDNLPKKYVVRMIASILENLDQPQVAAFSHCLL